MNSGIGQLSHAVHSRSALRVGSYKTIPTSTWLVDDGASNISVDFEENNILLEPAAFCPAPWARKDRIEGQTFGCLLPMYPLAISAGEEISPSRTWRHLTTKDHNIQRKIKKRKINYLKTLMHGNHKTLKNGKEKKEPYTWTQDGSWNRWPAHPNFWIWYFYKLLPVRFWNGRDKLEPFLLIHNR